MRELQDIASGLGEFRNTNVLKECAVLIGGSGGRGERNERAQHLIW